MGSTRFRNPPALSSVLAALGMLQLRAVGFLNRVDPLVSASNYYIEDTDCTVLSRCYAPFVVTPPPPPPLQREVTAKGHFLLLYTPPHLHMHTCVWLALTSMFTLVLRCYYVVIFAKCVRLFPCGRLRKCGTGL